MERISSLPVGIYDINVPQCVLQNMLGPSFLQNHLLRYEHLLIIHIDYNIKTAAHGRDYALCSCCRKIDSITDRCV